MSVEDYLNKTTYIEVPKSLLLSFVDEESCSFDHNHSCQAHGYFLDQGEKCPQYELKEILEKK